MKMHGYLFLALLTVLFCFSTRASAIRLDPTGDMYTDPQHPNRLAHGELWVAQYPPIKNFQRIMISFDFSAIRGQKIKSAYLYLNRFFGCPSGGVTKVDIYAITEPWDENRWPGNRHIACDDRVWLSFNFAKNGWHRLDITSLVRAWVNDSIPNRGLVIRARRGSKFSKFYSKEAPSPNTHPYLEIE